MGLSATDEAANAAEEGVSVEVPAIITEREMTDPTQKVARRIAGWLDLISSFFVIIIYVGLLIWIHAAYEIFAEDANSRPGDHDAELTHYAQQNLPPVGNNAL